MLVAVACAASSLSFTCHTLLWVSSCMGKTSSRSHAQSKGQQQTPPDSCQKQLLKPSNITHGSARLRLQPADPRMLSDILTAVLSSLRVAGITSSQIRSLTFSDVKMHTARLRLRARQLGSPLLLIAPPPSVLPARFASKDFLFPRRSQRTGAMIGLVSAAWPHSCW